MRVNFINNSILKTMYNSLGGIKIDTYDDKRSYYNSLELAMDRNKEINYLKKKLIKNKKILDIGSGGGRIVIPLLLDELKVDCLDKSLFQCQQLEEKINLMGLKLNIINNDILNYKSEKSCYGSILMINSVTSFIKDELELKQIFVKVHDILEKKGIFVFDFFRKQVGFNHYTFNNDFEIENDNEFIMREVHINDFPDYNLVDVYSLIIKNDKSYKLYKESNLEKKFEYENIICMLQETGFEILEKFDYENFGEKIVENTDNIMCLCRKV